MIFKSEGGIGEVLLNACVVKKDQLTGNVDSNQGLRTVFHQVEQALRIPFIDDNGERRSVARVYVITPYECSQTARQSIEDKLKDHSGQLTFLTGGRLFQLFAEHAPEYILFNSNFLSSYVAQLEYSFNSEDPLRFLATQHSIISAASRSFRELYVPQDFYLDLALFESACQIPDLRPLLSDIGIQELSRIAAHLKQLASLFAAFAAAEGLPESRRLESELTNFSSVLTELWEEKWNFFRSDETRARESRKEALLRLPEADANYQRGVLLIREIDQPLSNLRRRISRANDFVSRSQSALKAIHSPEYLGYCQLRELSKAAPAMIPTKGPRKHIQLGNESSERVRLPLLITAPAGYGKTSFSKYNAVYDAEALAAGTGDVFPVYVPLHQLATLTVSSFEEAFLRAPDLRRMFQDTLKGNLKRRIRLYLDGLDEVTTVMQQKTLVELATKAAQRDDRLQLVMTGRDYVTGPWLKPFARVHLSELTSIQSGTLVNRWLDNDKKSIGDFHDQVDKSPSIKRIMGVPLLASLTIAIFRKSRRLPENRNRLYEVFVDLLSGGWDLAKNVRRSTKFGTTSKLMVLRRLAGSWHLAQKREGSEADVRAAILQSAPMYLVQSELLLEEILQDGLLSRSGLNLEFQHLSFQEYLAALDMNDPTGAKQEQVLSAFLLGSDWWLGVLTFYIGLSGKPEDLSNWFIKVLRRLRGKHISLQANNDLPRRLEALIAQLSDAYPGFQLPRDRQMKLLG